MSRRVNVLGPLPPPFGGVSIHIVRFLELLKAEGATAVGYPYTGTTKQGKIGKICQALSMLGKIYFRLRSGPTDVLHVHYGGLGYFLAIAPILKSSTSRKVVTFHSVRVIQDLEGKPAWIRNLSLDLLSRFDLLIPVRAEIGEELGSLGLGQKATTVMPAFLPPADEERDLQRLPADVVKQLEHGMASGRQQVCCAAYYLGPGYGHDDLYGVEELLASLEHANDLEPWDLWVLVSNRPETSAQHEAAAAVARAAEKLSNVNLHLLYGQPLIPIMSRCGAFLRPSREDGDSVAIREAMSMGLPVLASDVVQRPEIVETFALAGAATTGPAHRNFLAELPIMKSGESRPVLPGEQDRFRQFVQEVLG
ncbi:MAG: glycosyltransferase involved in cell wall biosynthesis [Candidatus Krumholzibacteriia bacterium]|jgi:glycosyltransferase involved in cell wall biosynthesis